MEAKEVKEIKAQEKNGVRKAKLWRREGIHKRSGEWPGVRSGGQKTSAAQLVMRVRASAICNTVLKVLAVVSITWMASERGATPL